MSILVRKYLSLTTTEIIREEHGRNFVLAIVLAN